jgi:hypothetical protein
MMVAWFVVVDWLFLRFLPPGSPKISCGGRLLMMDDAR